MLYQTHCWNNLELLLAWYLWIQKWFSCFIKTTCRSGGTKETLDVPCGANIWQRSYPNAGRNMRATSPWSFVYSCWYYWPQFAVQQAYSGSLPFCLTRDRTSRHSARAKYALLFSSDSSNKLFGKELKVFEHFYSLSKTHAKVPVLRPGHSCFASVIYSHTGNSDCTYLCVSSEGSQNGLAPRAAAHRSIVARRPYISRVTWNKY